MWLDMYLHGRKYLSKTQWYTLTVNKHGVQDPDIDTDKIMYIISEVWYWRKANQIHKWFVDNVQDWKDDCGEYTVSRRQLEELLDTINKVLDDPRLARKLLPTAEWFFFWSNEYDEWYFQNLADTKKILKDAMGLSENGIDISYSSSW